VERAAAERSLTVIARRTDCFAVVQGRSLRNLLTAPIVLLTVRTRRDASMVTVRAYPNLIGLILGTLLSLVAWYVLTYPAGNLEHLPTTTRTLLLLAVASPHVNLVVRFVALRASSIHQALQLVAKSVHEVSSVGGSYRA
jgi:hypothetical protein